MIIELGDRLRKLRMENHLRQDQVARLVGVERSSVSLWESNLRNHYQSKCHGAANGISV